ncbi:hypothetical protein [Paraburkholderia oxyphila]|uniref:hypothetical protein n=1 Tax=Paraburkholderia oxyphila TaxID=614212 RepID=UPI0005BD90E7|nr:hypothetical protein [Paraburkholderia oxyphila]
MKLSKCLLLMALALSATGYAQTSQTYHFGEGQSGFGEGQSTPQREHASSTPPHTAAKPKSKPKHKPQHRRHTQGRSPLQDSYSRP